MNISIAMCTFNGEKYLKEQLDSLESQTKSPHEIVIVDDGSIDGTRRILEDYQKTSKLNVRLFYNEKNLGVVKAFEKSISLCHGDYISLCDQDDVWLPEKLELFFKRMREAEEKYGKDIPLLVYSDLIIVDKDLNQISPSMFKYYGRKQLEGSHLNSIFLENIVTGCASMFNTPLKNIALPFGENTLVHDWWLALVTSGFGKIVAIQSSTLLYRLHGKNLIGKKKGNFPQKIKKILKVDQTNSDLNKIFSQTISFIIFAKKYSLDLSELERTVNILDKGGISSILFSIKNKIFYGKNRMRIFPCLFFRPILKNLK